MLTKYAVYCVAAPLRFYHDTSPNQGHDGSESVYSYTHILRMRLEWGLVAVLGLNLSGPLLELFRVLGLYDIELTVVAIN